jgi:hypothetical protein
MSESRWFRAVELAGTLSVVATLMVLIVEVRAHAKALDRQSALEREARISSPYLTVAELPEIYATIKAKDGAIEPQVRAFVDRYQLSVPDAIRWVRHLDTIWSGLEIDYRYYGSTAELDRQITGLLKYPDERLYWETSSDSTTSNSAAFANRVRTLLHETAASHSSK